MSSHLRAVVRSLRKYGSGYLFVLPAMVLLTVFVIAPLMYAVYLSFFRYQIPKEPVFVGLSNYREMLTDALFWKSLKNTIVYTIGSLVLGLVGALLVAALLNNRLRGIRLFRVAYFFPSMTSTAVAAMIFLWLLDYQLGIFNYLFSLVGWNRVPWVIHPTWAMTSIILVGAWRGVSYNAPIYLAAMQSVPEAYYEAASIDGATSVQRFLFITLPSIAPVLVLTIIMAVIGSFQVIAVVDILTNGGPFNSTLVSVKYIFDLAFRYNRLGYACTVSIAIFVILLFFTYQQMRGSFAAEERSAGE